MKKIIFLLYFQSAVVLSINSQELFAKIDLAYHMLDSVAYVRKACEKQCISLGSEGCSSWKINQVAKLRVVFALNIDVDSVLINSKNYIKIDINEYKYSLIMFDKKWNIKDYICFANNKYYPFFVDFTGEIYSKKFLKGYKIVMLKKPKHILACFRLPYTILFILDKNIYVYQVWEEKIYELGFYLKKINCKDVFYFRQGNIEFP